MKEEIKKYVEEYIDDYYPDQEEGQYTGDADSLAYAFANKNEKNEDEVKKIIDKMIEDGELITDTIEWVNPENKQHTIRVDLIMLPSFVYRDNDSRHARLNQHSWELIYPDTYTWYESFQDFKNALIAEIEEDTNWEEENNPIELENVKKWEKWDDVVGYDIM